MWDKLHQEEETGLQTTWESQITRPMSDVQTPCSCVWTMRFQSHSSVLAISKWVTNDGTHILGERPTRDSDGLEDGMNEVTKFWVSRHLYLNSRLHPSRKSRKGNQLTFISFDGLVLPQVPGSWVSQARLLT